MQIRSKSLLRVALATMCSLFVALVPSGHVLAQTSESGSVGIEGTISAPPPSTPATITVPGDGASFSSLPVTVSGICTSGLLVKLFKNNVFSGAVQCSNGSFSIAIDLFKGSNELVARVFDELNQQGPDSNTVAVTYSDNRTGTSARVSLTSNFAKRGSNPGETLKWPIILSGGAGPYALSIDWGDGKTPDLVSQQFPGTFNIEHKYESPGVYNIIVKASDKNGDVAYLQLVGIANGKPSEDGAGTSGSGGSAGGAGGSSGSGSGATTGVEASSPRILWQPAAILIPFIFSTFWLGKRYELRVLRKKIEQGIHPFK
jgi:hypothetical protein